MTRVAMIRSILWACSKSLAKSLALSVAVIAPGAVLADNPQTVVLGVLWLFVGSFGLMAWTYRKPWRLGLISCLLPPLAAVA